MGFRVLVAGFSFVTAVVAVALIPAAYFGDKNEVWTKRLMVIGGVAAVVFLVALFW